MPLSSVLIVFTENNVEKALVEVNTEPTITNWLIKKCWKSESLSQKWGAPKSTEDLPGGHLKEESYIHFCVDRNKDDPTETGEERTG